MDIGLQFLELIINASFLRQGVYLPETHFDKWTKLQT